MWFEEFISNTVIQLFLAVFSSLLSYEVLKSHYNRPKIGITLRDLGTGISYAVTRQIKLHRKFPFILIQKICILQSNGKEFVLVLHNTGRSTAKGLSLSGWIPATWNVAITKASVFKGGIIEIDDWEREVDKFEYEDTEGNNSFRFTGDLPSTFSEYIKFQVVPSSIRLEFCLVGENVGHCIIKLKLKVEEIPWT